MAHFWCGNNDGELIADQVVQALRHLDDSFFVFLETRFDDRNADIVIFRASDDRDTPSTMIATEIKRFSTPVRGGINGCWEQEVTPGEWESLQGSGRDSSPYFQAVNTANTIKDWLYNHQRFFLDEAQLLPENSFRMWPDLLLLSPASVRHLLPIRMKFGFWFDHVDDWIAHLRGWYPKYGVGLSGAEIEAIADTLQLVPYATSASSTSPASLPSPAANNGIAEIAEELEVLEVQLATIRSRLANITHA